MKSYKGFNQDMTCRGFQYEEGKDYETEKANVCESGFHACEHPLDCFSYYTPSESVYHEVVQSGDLSRDCKDSKVASTKIHIGAKLEIDGIVKAAIEYVKEHVNPEVRADKSCGASSATGDYGASSATGDYGASSATGDYGASSATGYKGASSATGYKGASSATGAYGASSATGNCGASSTTGYKGASEAKDPCSIAVAWGYHGKAKGVLGSHLVLAEWEGDKSNYWIQDLWELKGAKMERVDGEKIKADTWYRLENGKFVECGKDDNDV